MSLADDLARALEEGATDGMRLAAEAVLVESNRNVPKGDPKLDPDPGTSLAESGRVEKTLTGYRVVYDADYAAFQHENLNLRHPRGGGPKFLEHALLTLGPQLDRFVATAVHSEVDRRAGRRGNRPA